MTPFKAALRYGGYTGLVLIVIGLITYLADIVDYSEPKGAQQYIQWLSYLILVIGIIMAIRYFKGENEGLMSFGQGVGTGTMTGLVIGIISAIWVMLFFYGIDPSALEEIRQAALDQALESGRVTEEQLEQSAGIMNMFTSPAFFGIMAIIMYTIIGLVVSLIASAIMKQD
jgi:amino acid transporter